MSYIDGFVIAVPTANKQKFIDHAGLGDSVFIDLGATRVIECWGDEVREGRVTDFRKAVQATDDEAVVFSWIEWPDKETRDAAMKTLTDWMEHPEKADPRMDPDRNPMPFDGKRLIYGGFRPLVELGRSPETCTGEKRVTIDAVVGASPEAVWQCWTMPEHITQWNFATDDWCCPSAENDLRAGGWYKARMEARDGSFGFDLEARYEEVVERKRLVYAMTDGRRVTTTFEALGGSTRVTTIFDPEKEHSLEMQRDGWQSILNNFKAYVERRE